jgi:hypothetical protein
MNLDEMSVLDRRRIEAMVLAPVFKAFAQEVGEARAREIMGEVIVRIAQEQGSALAQRMGRNDLQAFAESKGPWLRDDSLEIEDLEQSGSVHSYNVTRCRYAEMYRELGLPELGAILSCGRDFALCGGFNPDIRLTRTQTIMSGAAFCDFRYTIEEEGR